MTTRALESPTPLGLPKPAARPSGAPAERRPWPKEATLLAWVALAIGAIYRIRLFFHWRSLDRTEIDLAHNILTRGYRSLLFDPLDFSQGAPAGFLAIERFLTQLFGSGERILRLPSFIASLATIPLFFFLAKRILSLRGALLAILLFAGLDPLIHFSAELGPFAMDTAFALAIVLAATKVIQEPACEKNLAILFSVGSIAIFFSYPAAVVLAGAGAVALAAYLASGSRDGIVRSAGLPILCAATWIALEWLNKHFFLQPLLYGKMHTRLLRDWMTLGGFPPWQPNQAAHWVLSAFHRIFQSWETMYLSAPDLAMFVAAIGLAGLCTGRRRAVGYLLVLPLCLALAAAFRRQYPLGDRMALYLVPLLIIAISQGIDFIWGKDDMARSAVGGLAAVMLLAGSIAQSGYEFRWPGGREETKQIYQWLQRNIHDGDTVILTNLAHSSFDYYAPRTGLAGLDQLWQSPPGDQLPMDRPDLLEASAQGEDVEPWFVKAFTPPGFNAPKPRGNVVQLSDHSSDPGEYLSDIDHVVHPDPSWHWPTVGRVWIVFVRVEDTTPRVDQLCLAELDRLAQPGMRHVEDGAAVYFYDVPPPAQGQ